MMTKEYLESLINEINHDDRYNETNRIWAVSLEEGSSVVEVTILPEHKNIWGLPHGGILFAAADVAAGLAADSVRRGMHIVTEGSSIHFLYANPDAKKLRAEGRVIKTGKKINIIGADVYDELGNHLLTGQFTMYNTK
jgi:acyl-CoA thioesterase